jgi:spermidine/putrescine transport system ATP-binding protein
MHDLECQNVSKRFGPFTAVDDVSFQIPSGSFFSILGPSGCGKTTLMRMIAGFEEPASGDIRIKGRSVLGTPPNRRNVKMVFQHLALFPMMNVGENIAYGLRCRGLGKADIDRKVAEVLDRIGLPGVSGKEINQLSGGQKQRIAIARCMVLEPDVLLLDEPLGALDLKLRERMKIELKLLQHQFRTTFVYITHDQSEALVMSDRVAVMNGGRFEQVGTPQELFHAPKTAFVAGFVGDSNRWSGRVAVADGTGVLVETSTGARFGGVAGGGTDSALAPGETVVVFVRPGAIAVERSGGLATDPAAGVNRVLASIESVLFNGADSRVLARTQGGHLIEGALPQTGDSADLKAGEAVALTWRWEHTKCFREQA